MKRSFGFLVLCALFAGNAFAADSSGSSPFTSGKDKASAAKKMTPSVSLKNRSGSATGTSSSSSSTTPEATFSAQIENVRLTSDPNNCTFNWLADVHNTSSAPGTQGLHLVSSILNNGAAESSSQRDYPIANLAPGGTQSFTGGVLRTLPSQTGIIFHLKNGNQTLNTKTIQLPVQSDYAVSLGNSQLSPYQFFVTIHNAGASFTPSLTVAFRGITDAATQNSVRISEEMLTCVPPGSDRTISVSIPTPAPVGYRVWITRTGEPGNILADRTYNNP
jgi:hypothetical protein